MTVLPGLIPQSSPARVRVLRPDTYAQERWIVSTAQVKVWSSNVRGGKSYGACMDAIRRCLAIPGYPAALTRSTLASMRESTMMTFQRIVGAEHWAGASAGRQGYGWAESKHTFFFPSVRCDDGEVRQSRVVFFGWKDPADRLSTEYGLIVLEQAEQLEREHVVIAKTRLNFVEQWQEVQAAACGIRSRQLGLICNADDPEHWINQDYAIEERGMRIERDRERRETLEVILSHEDDYMKHTTEDYRLMLDSFRGTVFHERLVRNRWVRAEGLVYGAAFSPAEHIIDRPTEWAEWGGYPPPSQPRHRSMDFGIRHPFTCAWYAEQPDGTLICYRELYGTGAAPSVWGSRILEAEAQELDALRRALHDEDAARRWWPYLRDQLSIGISVSDHELGWREELARCGVWTEPAQKDIRSMVARLTSALVERRLFYVRDLLAHDPDPALVRDKLPTSVLQEYGRYKWPQRKTTHSETSDERLDAPVDRDNHGLDRDGYMMTAYLGKPAVF